MLWVIKVRCEGEPKKRNRTMMLEAVSTATPVLAAGWSLLYLLFGGGLGGAVLLFIVLKAVGR
jgi:hypothetical protein